MKKYNYLTQAQIDAYHKDGYLHLPGVYTEDDVKHARALIEEYTDAGGWEKAPFYDDGVTTDIYELIPGLAAIAFNDNYIQAMIDLFSPESVILAEPAIHRGRYYYWHKDCTFLDEQGETFHWESSFQAAMTVLYLQENHPDYGGGITVVPRTHSEPDFYHKIPRMSLLERGFLKMKKILKISHFDYLERHPEIFPIPTKVGDLLVLDMRLDHKGTPAKKAVPYTKYGIMNIACSGYEVAEKIRQALRRRTSGYYKEYLAKEPKQTPVLEKFEQGKEVKIWL